MSHLVVDTTLIGASEVAVAKNVAKLANAEVYGFNECSESWGDVIAKSLIIDALLCSEVEFLNQVQVDCLQGKLSEDLTLSC